MPLHEYLCEKCGGRIEIIQKFSDAPLTRCESCGGKLEQLLFAPAIKFKGSGWYITDYASGNGKGTSSDGSPKGSKKKKKKSGKNKDSSKAKTASGTEKSSTAK